MNQSPIMHITVERADPNTQMIGPASLRTPQPRDRHTIQLRWDTEHAGAASAEAGRPVFDRVLMLRLFYIGSTDFLDVELKRFPADGGPATITDRERYALYRAAVEPFERDAAATETGTPLATINLDPATIATLQAANVMTVEGLADVADSALDVFRAGGRAIRERARTFLAQSAENAPVAALAAENETLKADMAEAQQQIAELVAAGKAAAKAPRAKAGHE